MRGGWWMVRLWGSWGTCWRFIICGWVGLFFRIVFLAFHFFCCFISVRFTLVGTFFSTVRTRYAGLACCLPDVSVRCFFRSSIRLKLKVIQWRAVFPWEVVFRGSIGWGFRIGVYAGAGGFWNWFVVTGRDFVFVAEWGVIFGILVAEGGRVVVIMWERVKCLELFGAYCHVSYGKLMICLLRFALGWYHGWRIWLFSFLGGGFGICSAIFAWLFVFIGAGQCGVWGFRWQICGDRAIWRF